MAIEVDEESFEWCLDHASLIRVCDEIAQAHEQEMEEAETKWDLHLVGQQKQVEQLLGRVAMMAEALEDTLVRIEPLLELMPEPRRPTGWVQTVRDALRAAPKVLFSERARVLRNEKGDVKLVCVDNDGQTRVSQTPFPGVMRIMPDNLEDEILAAKVIILE